jgi:hypothetical protein
MDHNSCSSYEALPSLNVPQNSPLKTEVRERLLRSNGSSVKTPAMDIIPCTLTLPGESVTKRILDFNEVRHQINLFIEYYFMITAIFRVQLPRVKELHRVHNSSHLGECHKTKLPPFLYNQKEWVVRLLLPLFPVSRK